MAETSSRFVMGDAGISVFLLSVPFHQEQAFYEAELCKSIFPKYKTAVQKRFRGDTPLEKEFSECFYEPRAYCLFGRFDLAVLSLVDDFEFSSRTFHPFDPMMSGDSDKPYFENFLHKVIAGPTPAFGRDDQDGLVSLAQRTFLSANPKPLFGLSQFKLNNSLLIGTGTDLLRLVIRHAKKLADQFREQGLDVIILESYSWHELTLLLFAKSYRSITAFVTALKESSLKDLKEPQAAQCAEQALLALYLDHFDNHKECGESHLFADTDTLLGFDFRLFDDNKDLVLQQIDAADTIELSTRWFVKPGHLGDVAAVLGQDRQLGLAFGRGDVLARPRGTAAIDALAFHPTAECLKSFASTDTQLAPHVLQRYTTIVCPHEVGVRQQLSGTHPLFTDSIRNLRFPISELRELEGNLRRVGTPKILALKVLNMFANFNDGLLDRNLYGYFAELLPFMQDVQAMICRAPENWREDATTWCRLLKGLVENFELAYRNRFYNSHRLGEIADFNVDFKGGIHQLVTAFDGAYKAIASAVGNSHSFVSVTGEPAVYSTKVETRLNYFHVFQPEAFLTVSVHEAAWHGFQGHETRINDELQSQLQTLKAKTHQASRLLTCVWQKTSGTTGFSAEQADQDFFFAIILDRLAFCLTFNRERHLFWYWYWGYFAQLPTAYDKVPQRPSRVAVIEFLLRLCLVCEVQDRSTAESLLAPFLPSHFGAVWQQQGNTILEILESLRREPALSEWQKDAWSFVDSAALMVWREHRKNETLRIDDITLEVSRISAEYEASLARGEVIAFEEKGTFAPFRFCQVMSCAYLRLLQKTFSPHTDSILRRSPETNEATPDDQKGQGLFDPLGGLFTHDPHIRRTYFRVRSALTMSLWDMAVKSKKVTIWERLLASSSMPKEETQGTV